MCELQPPQERTRGGGPSDAHLRTGPDGRVWWIASPGSAQSVAHATQCSGIPAASVCSSGRYPMPPTSAHFATLGNRRLNAVTPDIAGIRRVQAGPYRATPDRLSPRQRRLLCSVRRDVQRRMRRPMEPRNGPLSGPADLGGGTSDSGATPSPGSGHVAAPGTYLVPRHDEVSRAVSKRRLQRPAQPTRAATSRTCWPRDRRAKRRLSSMNRSADSGTHSAKLAHSINGSACRDHHAAHHQPCRGGILSTVSNPSRQVGGEVASAHRGTGVT